MSSMRDVNRSLHWELRQRELDRDELINDPLVNPLWLERNQAEIDAIYACIQQTGGYLLEWLPKGSIRKKCPKPKKVKDPEKILRGTNRSAIRK